LNVRLTCFRVLSILLIFSYFIFLFFNKIGSTRDKKLCFKSVSFCRDWSAWIKYYCNRYSSFFPPILPTILYSWLIKIRKDVEHFTLSLKPDLFTYSIVLTLTSTVIWWEQGSLWLPVNEIFSSFFMLYFILECILNSTCGELCCYLHALFSLCWERSEYCSENLHVLYLLLDWKLLLQISFLLLLSFFVHG
jgi:hypothetical protein